MRPALESRIAGSGLPIPFEQEPQATLFFRGTAGQKSAMGIGAAPQKPGSALRAQSRRDGAAELLPGCDLTHASRTATPELGPALRQRRELPVVNELEQLDGEVAWADRLDDPKLDPLSVGNELYCGDRAFD